MISGELDSLFYLNVEHADPAAAMAARAFHDYPLMDYFNPNASARTERLAEVFRQTIRYGLYYGKGYATSPKLEGLALWLPYNKSRRTLWRRLRSGIFSLSSKMDKDVRERQRAFEAHMAGIHRRHAGRAQLYLQLLAVDPAHQGQGHSTRLLRAMFAGADAQGINSFLETHVPKNVDIYRHLGFEVVEEARLEGSELVTWAMLREAKR